MNEFTFRHRLRAAKGATALLALAFLGASCGSQATADQAELPSLDDGSEQASTDSGATADGAAVEMSEAEMTRALEQWRDCMFGEIPTGGTIDVSVENGLPNVHTEFVNVDDETLRLAEEKCDPIVAEVRRVFVGSQADVDARQERAVAFIECMNNRGWEDGQDGLSMTIGPDGFPSISTDEIDGNLFDLDEAECTTQSGLFEEG